MRAVRYALVFVLPVGIAMLLHVSTHDLRVEIFRDSAEWMARALSEDEATRAIAFAELPSAEHTRSATWLKILSATSVTVGAALIALLLPARATPDETMSFLTGLVCGFSMAKALIGFGFLGWPAFGAWLLAGLICALAVIQVRRLLARAASER